MIRTILGDRRLRISLAAALALLVAVGTWGHMSLYRFIRSSEMRRHEKECVRAVEHLSSLVRDAESGQRGFLLTGDETYLRPYHAAVSRSEAVMTDVVRAECWPVAERKKLVRDCRIKLAELSLTIRLHGRGKQASVAVVMEGRGRRAMDRIREQSEYLVAVVERVGVERDRRLARSAAAAMVAIPAVGAAAIGLTASGIGYAARQHAARVRAEEESRLARVTARRTADLLNAMSHDLRTPLNAIVQAAELGRLLCELGDAEPRRILGAFLDVKRSAMGQAQLLESFLSVSRAERTAPRIERFAVAEILGDVAHDLRGSVREKGLSLSLSFDARLTLESDKSMVRQVVQNLAVNAVKFTERGSVHIGARACPGGIVIQVRDTGPGIPPDKVAVMFEDFRQGHNPERDPGKGFGLGLGIVSRLCRRLGADVSYTPRIGGGSVFTVRFPDLDPVREITDQGTPRDNDGKFFINPAKDLRRFYPTGRDKKLGG
jgi:signal transduction histidine kinase